MSASISEVVKRFERVEHHAQGLTTGQSFSTTVPYTSTHTTAEWIEETPLLIGTNAGFASLPNLSIRHSAPRRLTASRPGSDLRGA